MNRFATFICSVSLLSFGASVQAADLIAPPPGLAMQSPHQVQEWGNGWYLRGDAAWRTENQPQLNATLNFTGVTQRQSSFAADIGAGYNINGWLRADITYGWRQSHTDVFGARTTGKQLLANAYVDLGTWNSITPYIGVGAGESFRRSSAPTVRDQSKNTFAWALMAGLGFSVTENIKLDIGYRYLNLGKASGLVGAVPFSRTLDSHEARLGVRYVIE